MRLVPLNINICPVTQNGMCHMSRDCRPETKTCVTAAASRAELEFTPHCHALQLTDAGDTANMQN